MKYKITETRTATRYVEVPDHISEGKIGAWAEQNPIDDYYFRTDYRGTDEIDVEELDTDFPVDPLDVQGLDDEDFEGIVLEEEGAEQ